MKTCPKCNKTISDYALTCPYCNNSDLDNAPQNKKSASNYKLLIISLLIIPALIISIVMIFLFSEQDTAEKKYDDLLSQVQKVEEYNSQINNTIEKSAFVGEWICLSKNSCNNKQIILTVTQENGQLNIVRDMESNTSSGSKITFSVDVPSGNTFYSSNTKGTYTLENGVLTEAFDDNKTNYYSVTGELTNNICKFAFCSDECGELSYCEMHDTTDKRYNSLTNSNKKTICYYIEGRYDYYDEINGGYAGDKYSDTIMQEAANKYGITSQQTFIIWSNMYSY